MVRVVLKVHHFIPVSHFNLWLSGNMNDVWQYNTISGQWTWLGGSNSTNQLGTYGTLGVASAGNVIGARRSHTAVMSSSNTMLVFGGFGYDSSGQGTSFTRFVIFHLDLQEV